MWILNEIIIINKAFCIFSRMLLTININYHYCLKVVHKKGHLYKYVCKMKWYINKIASILGSLLLCIGTIDFSLIYSICILKNFSIEHCVITRYFVGLESTSNWRLVYKFPWSSECSTNLNFKYRLL